jgi:signal transduction histidine kinase
VRARVHRDGGNAIIDVLDTGPGIPAAEHEQVFIPFYRLPGETKGSGLGLSIARQIARLHGGNVAVMPQISHGSCIRVTLPMS